MQSDKLDIISIGGGPITVLALHASGTGAGSLMRFANALGDQYQVHLLNLSGYGGSISTSAQYPIEQHLDVARRALDQLEASDVHLFGHSMGALVCLRLASTARERLRSLTLVEPVTFGLLDPQRDADVIELDRQSVMGLKNNDADGVQRFIEFWNGSKWAKMPQPVQQKLESIRSQITGEALAISANRDTFASFAAITCPVQLLMGQSTNPVAQRVGERFSEHFPQWPIHLVDGAGHMLPIEQPGRTADLTGSFIQNLI